MSLALSTPTSMSIMLYVAFLLIWIERIHALAYNITINADSPLISYIPSTSWTRLVDDQNRVYMQTDDPDAYATIMYRFYGFSFLSPARPYPLRANITVDEMNSIVVDFQDYEMLNRRRKHNTNVVVRYSASGNRAHIVRVGVPKGDMSTLVGRFIFQVDSAGDTKFPKPRPGDIDGFTVTVDSSSSGFTTDSNGSPLVITQTLYARKFKLPGNHDLRVFVGMLLAFACLIAALIVGCGSWFILMITVGLPCCPPSQNGNDYPRCPIQWGRCMRWGRNPSLEPAMAMVDHNATLHAASQSVNLDGADPPPSLVIGDGSDAPNQSPLQRQVLSTSVYADPYSQQSRPTLEVPSSTSNVPPSAARNVNKEVLYGDGSDGPSRT